MVCVLWSGREGSGAEVFKKESQSSGPHNCSSLQGRRHLIAAVAIAKPQPTPVVEVRLKFYGFSASLALSREKRNLHLVQPVCQTLLSGHYYLVGRLKHNHGEIVAAVADGSCAAVVQSRNVPL